MDWPVSVQTLAVADTPTGTYSTSVTGGGSGNTKGSYAEVKSALPFDVIGIMCTFQTQPSAYQVLDIAIGAAGSEQIIVPNWNLSSSLSGTHANNPMFIPVYIPAGSRVAVRTQGSSGSAFSTCKLIFLGGAYGGHQPPYRWKDYTQVSGTPYGVAVTPGSGAKGSWAEVAAATEFTSRWISIAVQGATSPEDINLDVGVGASSSEVVAIPDFYYSIENLAVQWCIPFTFPAGTRLSARSKTNGATTAHGVAIHIGA